MGGLPPQMVHTLWRHVIHMSLMYEDISCSCLHALFCLSPLPFLKLFFACITTLLVWWGGCYSRAEYGWIMVSIQGLPCFWFSLGFGSGLGKYQERNHVTFRKKVKWNCRPSSYSYKINNSCSMHREYHEFNGVHVYLRSNRISLLESDIAKVIVANVYCPNAHVQSKEFME